LEVFAIISIPSGAIKRYGQFLAVGYGNDISIPSGAIKSENGRILQG